MARQGFAVIARVDSVHSEESETADDPPTRAQFDFAQGRCLELLYVGRDFSMPGGDEAYLRPNTSEDEKRAHQEMLFRLTQEDIKKGSH
jgi:hypothetical protein